MWKYPSIGGNYNHHWVALRYALCIDTVVRPTGNMDNMHK